MDKSQPEERPSERLFRLHEDLAQLKDKNLERSAILAWEAVCLGWQIIEMTEEAQAARPRQDEEIERFRHIGTKAWARANRRRAKMNTLAAQENE